MKTKSKTQQVGGNHYESLKIQPIVLISRFNMNWFQGEVLKYISRTKNGLEDLHKGIHVSDMANDLHISTNLIGLPCDYLDLMKDYTCQFIGNRLDTESYWLFMNILTNIILCKWEDVSEGIVRLRDSLYGAEE